MIKVVNLKKSFGAELLFSNLNFVIPKGSITAIMGISGKGKTTLLRLLAGLDKEFEGTIENVPEKAAWVFQEDRLLPWLNLYDNLALVLPRKEGALAAVLAALRLVGLEGDKFKMPSELSGGMQRRAALARALLFQADYMFLDEPFAALDRKTKLDITESLFALAKEKVRTLVIVTHDAEIVERADNIIDLGEARII